MKLFRKANRKFPEAPAASLCAPEVVEFPMIAYMGRKIGAQPLSVLIRKRRRGILRLAARHGAHHLRLFGSAVRGEDTERSDIDFLVAMRKNRSLFDLVNLSLDLEALLGRKVDVVTERGLSPYLREGIQRQARPL